MNGNYFRSTPYNNFMSFTRQAPRPGLLNILSGGSNIGNLAGTSSKLSFGSILNGASKTLNFINQAIPVYYQVKPMWNNVKTMVKVAQAVKNNDTQTVTINKIPKDTNSATKNIQETNNPTFFI